jgi:hypothetical protein
MLLSEIVECIQGRLILRLYQSHSLFSDVKRPSYDAVRLLTVAIRTEN